jgi:hypothetical protein
LRDRLRNIATKVLAQATEDPSEWYGEWAEWLHSMLGPPPDQSVGSSLHDEYKVFALGSILAWGYFGEMLKETDAGPVADGEGAGDAPGPDGGGDVLDTSPGALLIPKQTFTILGADGEPLVEGRKD